MKKIKNEIEIALEKFCNKFGLTKEINFPTIINNGEKHLNSIVSKVKRKVNSGDIDFSLAKLHDLCRCAVIIPSYKDALLIIAKLREKFNYMSGFILRLLNGYTGIHLIIVIDNLQVEIQLATLDSWRVKSASEQIYKRHRDFEGAIPKLLTKIYNSEGKQKEKLLKEFTANYKVYAEEYFEMSKLFNLLNTHTDLFKNVSAIESLLLSYQIDNKEAEINSFEYDKYIRSRLTNLQGEVDESKLLSNYKKIRPTIKNIQAKVLNNIQEVMQNINLKEVYEFTPMQKFLYELRESLNKNYFEYLKGTKCENYIIDYPEIIRNSIDDSVKKTINFAIGKGVDFETTSTSEFLLRWGKTLFENDLIVSPDKFTNFMKQEIQKLDTTKSYLKLQRRKKTNSTKE